MGVEMATNLVTAGYRVIAHTRSVDRTRDLAAIGLEPTTDITELFQCEIVISTLPDDAAVSEVVLGREHSASDGLARGLAPGAVHLSMGTISSEAASRLAAEHASYGSGYVAAPVFGNPDAAKSRELYILAAGAPIDIERCQPIFKILGQQTFIIGADPGAANLLKLAGNMLTATTLEMLGEVMALLRKRGLEPEPFMKILTATMFGSRVHRIYGEKIATQGYSGGFLLPLALKDVRLALSEAEAAAVPMPSVSVVRDRLIAGIAHGHAGLDWSALGLIAAEEAGLRSEVSK
jgi:3-hydroxyisobutyrate dehydrogenase-like beta-hydroxyacid dehydrogenase